MILRILFFLAILLVLPLWGMERWLLKPGLPRHWRIAIAVPNVLLLAGLALMAIDEDYSAESARQKALLLTATLCIGIPELLLALFLLAGRLCRKPLPRRILTGCGLTVGFTALAGLVYGFTCGYKHLVVKQETYVHADIPEKFDGYRIVQLSDLHLGTLHGHDDVVRRIVDSVNAQKPDLIVFTGDLVNYRAEELFEFEPLLRRMQARDGIVAIMGNHDYMQYHRWGSEAAREENIRLLQDHIRGMGWRLLLNEHHILRNGTDSLAVVGVENDGNPPFPALGDLPKAQQGLTDSHFQILLSHDPTHWRRRVLPETRIPLMLAGHTHGMQFKIGDYSPAVWFYPEWGGFYREGDRTLYVSLGTGEVMLPFRLGAWPEITVLTLHKK